MASRNPVIKACPRRKTNSRLIWHLIPGIDDHCGRIFWICETGIFGRAVLIEIAWFNHHILCMITASYVPAFTALQFIKRNTIERVISFFIWHFWGLLIECIFVGVFLS